MLSKIILMAATVALMVLMTPAPVDAYGAAHVGYTHVGPSGVYHTGETAVAGPRGVSETSHTTAVGAGGGAYHSEQGYRYTPSYGGAVGGEAHYAYVR